MATRSAFLKASQKSDFASAGEQFILYIRYGFLILVFPSGLFPDLLDFSFAIFFFVLISLTLPSSLAKVNDGRYGEEKIKMNSKKSEMLRKVNYQIGELLLFVSQRKKFGPDKYSQKKYELTYEELEEIYTVLNNIMKKTAD